MEPKIKGGIACLHIEQIMVAAFFIKMISNAMIKSVDLLPYIFFWGFRISGFLDILRMKFPWIIGEHVGYGIAGNSIVINMFDFKYGSLKFEL